MEMNEKAKSRLYGLTSILCLGWLGQAAYQAWKSDQLWTILNLIFYVSMIIVVAYTGFSAFESRKKANQ